MQTLDDIRKYAEEMGISPRGIKMILAEIKVNENNELESGEYLKAMVLISILLGEREEIKQKMEIHKHFKEEYEKKKGSV